LEKDGKNKTGDTALHWASRNGQEETVHLLLEKDAAVDGMNEKSETALDVAKANGHSKVVTLLSEIIVRHIWIKMPSRICGKQKIQYPITHNYLLVTDDQSENCI
jgi:hypothetical protein